MALSTIQKIDRVGTDSDLFHTAVHGVATQTVQTENGPVPTLAGALASLMAYNERGEWVAGMTLYIKDVVTHNGIAYVSLPSAAYVSNDFDADLAAGKLAVHQGATREDLAQSGGASFIGFVQSFLGALVRTLQDKSRDTLSTNDFPSVQTAVNAAILSGKQLLLEPDILIPQVTVTGRLLMKAKGRVVCDYDGTNGEWIDVPVGADSSIIEFDEIDFNAHGVMGVRLQANACTVIVRDAHNLSAQEYTTGNRQGVVVSEGTDNIIDVSARDLRVGSATQGSIPRIVTTDTGSARNRVKVRGYQCWVGWCDNGTDNTAECVIVDQCGADGIYNLAPSAGMKCNFLQVTNSVAQPFVLEGVNAWIGTAVVDGWGFAGIQGCTRARVDHLHVLPSPDGTPSRSVLRSRDGNTTADISIGRITGTLIVGSDVNAGALMQFAVGTVNCRVTDGIDLDVIYSAASAAGNFVVHTAGSAEVGSVRIRFDDSASQPAAPMSWQIPVGSAFTLRGWTLDPRAYNYLVMGGVNASNIALPPGLEISAAGSITNPSSSNPPVRILISTAAPTVGAWNRGDTVYNKFPSTGNAVGWRCAVAGSPGTWRIMGQNGVASGPTSSRPTAATMGVVNGADWAGTRYRDTTLAANGKPIEWTGTVWVDATGAAV